jgi:hypothetical protein
MTTMLTRAALFVVLAAQGACIAIPLGKQGPTRPKSGDPGSTARAATKRDGSAFGLKPVFGKQPPSLLLARDGTECTVSEERFERTIIGRSVWCIWTHPGE